MMQYRNQFRMENGLDAILGSPQTQFFLVQKFFPHELLGFDNEGRHVLLLHFNHVNWDGIAAHTVSRGDLLRHFLFLWEYIISEDSGAKIVLVVDMENIGLFNIAWSHLSLLRRIITMTALYYPDYLHATLAINASCFMSFAWTLMSFKLDWNTCWKCTSFSPAMTASQLKLRLSQETLPEIYGGTATTSDSQLQLVAFVKRQLKASILSTVDVISTAQVENVVKETLCHKSFKVLGAVVGRYDISFKWNPTLQMTLVRGHFCLPNTTPGRVFDYIKDPMKRPLWDTTITDIGHLGYGEEEEKTDILWYTRSYFPRGSPERHYGARQATKCCDTKYAILWKYAGEFKRADVHKNSDLFECFFLKPDASDGTIVYFQLPLSESNVTESQVPEATRWITDALESLLALTMN